MLELPDLCPGLDFTVSVYKIPRWVFDLVSFVSSNLLLRGLTWFVADYVSAFPSGINVAATWDRSLAFARGAAMGEEHRDKGVDVQLGPVCGPLGRAPEGGRNWV